VKVPEPLIVSWQGRQVRVRHDDPLLGPYTPRGAVSGAGLDLHASVDGEVIERTGHVMEEEACRRVT
jgi:hypothetical protein